MQRSQYKGEGSSCWVTNYVPGCELDNPEYAFFSNFSLPRQESSVSECYKFKRENESFSTSCQAADFTKVRSAHLPFLKFAVIYCPCQDIFTLSYCWLFEIVCISGNRSLLKMGLRSLSDSVKCCGGQNQKSEPTYGNLNFLSCRIFTCYLCVGPAM